MERHGKRGGKERGEGIERQEQVHLQFDEADKKETGGGGERVLTVILFDSSFLPSRAVI